MFRSCPNRCVTVPSEAVGHFTRVAPSPWPHECFPVRLPNVDERDITPDVRDGLTRAERVILWQLHELQKERGGRNVPSAMLYGRVVEHVDMSVATFQKLLQRLVGGPGIA